MFNFTYKNYDKTWQILVPKINGLKTKSKATEDIIIKVAGGYV